MALQASESAVVAAADTDASAPRRDKLRFLRNGKTLVGLSILGFFVLLAIFGDMLAPYDPSARGPNIMASPSWDHPFGTTQTGQDIFSQILVGTRGVLVVGFVAAVLATVLGVLIGVTAGYLGGFGDDALSSLSNIFLVIPGLPLIIIITSFLPETNDLTIAAVIGLTSWAWGARVLRAQTLSLRNRDYVQAARATGESTWRIIVFELLPNLTPVIATGFIGTVIFAVLSNITLAFIGIADISEWNWGTVLFWAQNNQALAQDAWWWFVPAGLCIALLGTSLALINYGIDEFINPRLRNEKADRTVTMRVGFTPVLRDHPGVPANAANAGPLAKVPAPAPPPRSAPQGTIRKDDQA
ncbi:ABC transporter permease subunit [Streptomyces sp. 3MP-14]|uniref:ABC transporter permease subunit n=1 Tax=Streptomyces mimosae TaxID=2586635 RepID=A0A5N5ZZ09_9ACTN|nr:MULTISPECIES: ABC transporter permease [Streptomyces]KAB8161172.1 ABC transporter permease subunit [Streptomyces mimosae]KAB8178983.1 ABC transporter permease subunit [Streptomyces sp. 3MP-14]